MKEESKAGNEVKKKESSSSVGMEELKVAILSSMPLLIIPWLEYLLVEDAWGCQALSSLLFVYSEERGL